MTISIIQRIKAAETAAVRKKRRFRKRRGRNITAGSNHEKAKRGEYAKMPSMFKSNMSRAAKLTLDGEIETTLPSIGDMLEFWSPIFECPSIPVAQHPTLDVHQQKISLAQAITTTELDSINIANGSAPGLDGVTPAAWRPCPVIIRTQLSNQLTFPEDILASRTDFVPKNVNASSPSDFKPISITSVVVRQLHKILAKRMMACGIIDERQ